MPNDLGQPRNGKIRSNSRFEHDISDYKSKRATVDVYDLTCSLAAEKG